jgi:hypothetical protein
MPWKPDGIYDTSMDLKRWGEAIRLHGRNRWGVIYVRRWVRRERL